jgi:diguanylate cyclase (GGDEF)-like protein
MNAFINFSRVYLVIPLTWMALIVIDFVNFPVFEKINYFNFILEILLSFFSLYPLIAIQRYRKLIFYRALNIGFYLLFISLFVDGIDQIFIHSIPYTVVAEKVTLFIASILIFIGGRQWMENFQQISLTDELTNLPNRKRINNLVNQQIMQSRKNKGTFFLVMVDIDFFKEINDKHGHIFGDSILKKFADLMLELKMPEDFVGRWGGEEFLILIKAIDKSKVVNNLNKLREKILAHPFIVEDKKIFLTASFGVSQFNYPYDDYHKLLVEADKALYLAKRIGRNRVE